MAMRKSAVKKLGLLLTQCVCLLGSGLVAGCAPPRPLEIHVCLDVSSSWTKDRAASETLQPLVAGLLSDTEVYRPMVVLWQFAAEPAVLFNGQPVQALPVAKEAIAALGTTIQSSGTMPDRQLNAIMQRWSSSSADAFFIVMITDGEISAPEAMPAAIQALAAEPRLAWLWLVGVRPEWQPTLRSGAYAPVEDRLWISGLSRPDVEAGLAELKRRVQGEVWR